MGRHSRKRNAPSETMPGVGAGAGAAAERPVPGRQRPVAGPPTMAGPPTVPGPYRQAAGQRPPAVPRPYPGSPDPATPAHGSPLPGHGTPPEGVPRVRGGHPEQREPGGAWGAARTGGTGPEPGGGTSPGGPGPATAGRRRVPPGPRQEYLDAFDDDVFAAGAPSRTSPAPGVPRSRGPGDRVAGPPQVGGAPGRPGPPGPEDGTDAVPQPDEPAEGRPERARSKGRTFTGVAAAAVTTVLAIVVAGQVTGLEQRKESRAASADTGTGHDDDAPPREGPSPAPSAAPPTYAEMIARVRPLDPDLHGPGDFTTVGGRQKASGRGEVVRYRVDVEKGLPLDGEFFAEAVHRTLNDERSWAHEGARSFERVADGDDADFVITLASPGTTGEWCAKSGLDTTVRNVSCDSAATERIMINAWRWAQGSETFGEERIREYREMLVNHEVGHRLGLGHRFCESDGALAPVMMQQTKTLTTGERTCRPNAWPYPEQNG